jgi:hypothetical protein
MFLCFCFVLFVFVLGTGFLAVQGQGPGSSSILFPLHYNNSMRENLFFLFLSSLLSRRQSCTAHSPSFASRLRIHSGCETKPTKQPTNQPTTGGFGSKPNDDWGREIGNGDGDVGSVSSGTSKYGRTIRMYRNFD